MQEQHIDTLPTVNTNALLLTVSRLASKKHLLEEQVARITAELAAARKKYDSASAELETGSATSGPSHARFDNQSQRWSIKPSMFRAEARMQASMRKLIFTVFQIDAPPTEDMAMNITGAEVRRRIQMYMPTRSAHPLRMFHLHRTELIRRDILRLV
jgi:hypothetical protein